MNKQLTSIQTVSCELKTKEDMTKYLTRFKKVESLDNAVESVLRRNNIRVQIGTLKQALECAERSKLGDAVILFLKCAIERRISIVIGEELTAASKEEAYDPNVFFDFSKLNK